VIDLEVAEMAARRGKPDQTDRLMHFIENEKLAYESKNTILIIHAERLFHNYIGVMSGNELLKQFQETINNRMLLILALSSTLENEVGFAIDEHLTVAKALKDGDPKAAKRAMADHLRSVETRIRKRIK
jgi:DNA-binding GntR family transcriptional regulator